jgi:hypothetical protein
MSERWPLHPLPWELDLLTRWVRNIAQEYGLSYHAFCHRVLNLSREEADQLNENPSDKTLQILAKGSGQPLERLREMTRTGMIKKRDEMIEQAFREDPEGMESMIARMRDAIMKPSQSVMNERS